MKNSIKTSLLFVALLTSLLTKTLHAQNTQASQPSYKDVVKENPNAEADIKLVSDFLNALVSGDLDKVKTLLAPQYKGFGPSPNDSANIEQTLSIWAENNKTYSDRKITFVNESFTVLSGDLKGTYVSAWGDFHFTVSNKKLSFPFQYTARVSNGKIDFDRVYYDRMYIFQTLGYKITPPEN